MVELGNKNFTRCKLFVFMFFCGYNHVIIFPSWRLSVAQMWISSVFTTITGHSSAKGLYTWTSYLGGCWYKCKKCFILTLHTPHIYILILAWVLSCLSQIHCLGHGTKKTAKKNCVKSFCFQTVSHHNLYMDIEFMYVCCAIVAELESRALVWLFFSGLQYSSLSVYGGIQLQWVNLHYNIASKFV